MPNRSTALGAVLAVVLAQASAAPLELIQTVPLESVSGRLDHLALDAEGQRLFVAALGNDSLEVIDLRTGQRIRSVGGFSEPQGVEFAPGLNRVFVANGDRVDVLDGGTLAVIAKAEGLRDADNLRYDATRQRVYVGFGGTFAGLGHAGIRMLDAGTAKTVGEVALSAHPESFQIDRVKKRLYVNVPGVAHVAVADLDGTSVKDQWALGDASSNFPMALDSEHHRLFVATRSPSRLLAFDTDPGRIVATLELPGDPDDLFYDAARHRIYASCGDGFLVSLAQDSPDGYHVLESMPTARGARTSLFDPAGGRLYLAVPAGEGHPAQVRVYAARSPSP
jgi:hypothetical protein